MFKTAKLLLSCWVVEYFNKKYPLKLVEHEQEKTAVLNFRKSIYQDELKYSALNNTQDNNKHLIENEYIFFVGNINNILGTITVNSWSIDYLPNKFLSKYHLAAKNLKDINQVAEFHYFMIKPNLRNSWLSVCILSQLYNYFPILNDPDIFFGNSLLNLIKLYMKLGCFFYTQDLIYDEYGDITLPFAILPFDLHYLKTHDSIFYTFSKKYLPNSEKLSKRGYKIPHGKHLSKNFHIVDNDHFFSLKTLDDNFINTSDELINLIMRNTTEYDRVIVHVQKDRNIIPIGESDYSLYIIINGEFEVFQNEKSIVVLTSQDVFGEIALFTEEGIRTANIRCLKNGKIMMIKYKFFNQLEKRNPKLACRFYYLFGRKLSQKLIKTTKDFVL